LHACSQGHLPEVCRLLEGRMPRMNASLMNAVHGTPLQVATVAKQYETVQWLLNHRADPNMAAAPSWSRPLAMAVQAQDLGAASILLAAGAGASPPPPPPLYPRPPPR
jgi:hypothetical protein